MSVEDLTENSIKHFKDLGLTYIVFDPKNKLVYAREVSLAGHGLDALGFMEFDLTKMEFAELLQHVHRESQ